MSHRVNSKAALSAAEACAAAFVRGDVHTGRVYANQLAVHLGDRGARIREGLTRASAPKLKHWEPVAASRAPYVPLSVRAEVRAWEAELDAAERLVAAGERVLPLLINGETRCGKTSLASVIGTRRGLPVYRLALARAVDSHMGETAKLLSNAMLEMAMTPAVWLVDEIDAVAFTRGGGEAAAQERAHAVGALLTLLDEIAPSQVVIATTNMMDTIDSAVLGRFRCVRWPEWSELPRVERGAFVQQHGGTSTDGCASYAEAVHAARSERVARVLAAPAAEAQP